MFKSKLTQYRKASCGCVFRRYDYEGMPGFYLHVVHACDGGVENVYGVEHQVFSDMEAALKVYNEKKPTVDKVVLPKGRALQ